MNRAASRSPHGSIALLVSVAANALGGLLLWLIAARLHEASAVGDASALFQGVLFVNFASSLGLPILLIAHFAVGQDPRATHRRRPRDAGQRPISVPLPPSSSSLRAATADLLDPLWAMGTSTGSLVYVVLSVGAGLSVLFEARLITLRLGIWWTARSLFVADRPVPLVLFITTDGAGDEAVQALFIFATGPVAASGLLGGCGCGSGGPPDRRRATATRRPRPPEPLRGRELVGLLCTQGPIFMVPVIVAFSVDGSENAPFYVAWSFGAITFLLPQMIGQIVLSEAVRSPSWVQLLFRALRLSLVLTTLCAAGACVAAPIVASVYGEGFESVADHLPLVVGAGVAWSYTSIGLAASRLRERYGDIVLISVTFVSPRCSRPCRSRPPTAQPLRRGAGCWQLPHRCGHCAALSTVAPRRRRRGRSASERSAGELSVASPGLDARRVSLLRRSGPCCARLACGAGLLRLERRPTNSAPSDHRPTTDSRRCPTSVVTIRRRIRRAERRPRRPSGGPWRTVEGRWTVDDGDLPDPRTRRAVPLAGNHRHRRTRWLDPAHDARCRQQRRARLPLPGSSRTTGR